MSKSPDAFRTISEVAEWLGVQAHVLRFWESKFTQVKPIKRAGGRRYYRPADMLLLGGIRKLLHDDGMSIKEVQAILRDLGISHVSDMSHSLDAATPGEQTDGAGGGAGASSAASLASAGSGDAEPAADGPTPIENDPVAPLDSAPPAELTSVQSAEDIGLADSHANDSFEETPVVSGHDAPEGPSDNQFDTEATPADVAIPEDEPQQTLATPSEPDSAQDIPGAQDSQGPMSGQADIEIPETTQDAAPEPVSGADALLDQDMAAVSELPQESAADPAPGAGSVEPAEPAEPAEPEQFMMDLSSPEPMADLDTPEPSPLEPDAEITAAPTPVVTELDAEPLVAPSEGDASFEDTGGGSPAMPMDPQETGPGSPTSTLPETSEVAPVLSDDWAEDVAATGAAPLDQDVAETPPLTASLEDTFEAPEGMETAPLTAQELPMADAEVSDIDMPENNFAASSEAPPLSSEPEAPAAGAAPDPLPDSAAEAKPRIIAVADEDLAAQVNLRSGVLALLAQASEIPPHAHGEVAACAAELRAWLESN